MPTPAICCINSSSTLVIIATCPYGTQHTHGSILLQHTATCVSAHQSRFAAAAVIPPHPSTTAVALFVRGVHTSASAISQFSTQPAHMDMADPDVSSHSCLTTTTASSTLPPQRVLGAERTRKIPLEKKTPRVLGCTKIAVSRESRLRK